MRRRQATDTSWQHFCTDTERIPLASEKALRRRTKRLKASAVDVLLFTSLYRCGWHDRVTGNATGAPKASLKDKFNSCAHSLGAQGIQLNKMPLTYFPSLHLPYARGGLTRKREGGNTQKGQELDQGKGLHYAHHHRERLGAPKGAWPELEFKGKGIEQERRRKKQRQRWRESPPAKMSQKNKFKTQWRNRNGHDSVSLGYLHENPWRVLRGQDRGFAEMPGSFLLLAMGSDIC